jgi:hypothetical protein
VAKRGSSYRHSIDAREIVLTLLIDDPGLFPPARKPMDQAIADHERARAGAAAFMLGRFLCPVSRLDELAQQVEERWSSLGAICDGTGPDWLAALDRDLARLASFSHSGDVDCIELRVPPEAAKLDIERLVDLVRRRLPGRTISTFLEVSDRERGKIAATLEAIAATPSTPSLGAKLRCGGLDATAFPPAAAVAAFISHCRQLRLSFKTTAGLHHPFRTPDRDLHVLQHGFVNLLAATALPAVDLGDVIEESDASAFELGPTGLGWRGHHADAQALERARHLFSAFGSCSFEEPVEDLASYGLLPAGVA